MPVSDTSRRRRASSKSLTEAEVTAFTVNRGWRPAAPNQRGPSADHSGGRPWLGGICPGGVPAFSRSYHKSAIQRRLRISRLALTAYRAGVHIFTTSTEELQRLSGAVLFLYHPKPGEQSHRGSTRVAALAHLGELLCSIHYVCPGIGKIALTDELTAFNNQTAAFRGLRRVMVFAGESYASVLSELEAVYPHGDTKLIPYGEAYRRLRLPVHLLSCDDTGAIQLQILATPGYRPRLTQAALKSQYVPPPEGAPALDAMFQGLPFRHGGGYGSAAH